VEQEQQPEDYHQLVSVRFHTAVVLNRTMLIIALLNFKLNPSVLATLPGHLGSAAVPT
jgi:hypothetical protein